MDMGDIAIQLQKTEDRSLRNEGRIRKLEEEHEALHQLATAVAVLAEKMDGMNRSVDTLATKVDALESEPAQKWRFVVEKAIYFIVAGVAGFVLAQIGLV